MQDAKRHQHRANVGIALGTAWGGLSGLAAAIDLNGGPSAMMLLLSGWATAVYTVVLFLARTASSRRTIGAVALALVGLSHIVWLLALVAICNKMVPTYGFSGDSEFSALLLLTGFGYAITIGLCTASWTAGVIVAGAGAIAFAWTLLPMGAGDVKIALGLVTLHAGIVVSLARDAYRHLRPRWQIGSCQACGYDLAGLASTTCPECGASAASIAHANTVARTA